jgi:uncharacterized protein (UPF0276 family)
VSINSPEAPTSVGVAYSSYILPFLHECLESLDYVEVPFELIRHDPSVLRVSTVKPVVLHCASLSIAGTVRPAEETVQAIRQTAEATGTPWIGEHLSFIAAERPENAFNADEYAPGEPYNIGYTVSPR